MPRAIPRPASISTMGSSTRDPVPQSRFWMLTVPHHGWTPYLPKGVTWIRGQLELGKQSGELRPAYLHWQIVLALDLKGRRLTVRNIFGDVHAEPTRSAKADEYVFKEETRVQGTQFELGVKPFRRNSKHDWDGIWESATLGDMGSIPTSIRIQSYASLRRIAADYAKPVAIERSCTVYWGSTGTGKSRRAWEEAGMGAYPKNPRTKFWCGYQGQEHVVIDEFRGTIDIANILTWLDRYPVCVEIKGSSTVLRATTIWITSNLHPREWYPGLDSSTQAALVRRLKIVCMNPVIEPFADCTIINAICY